MAFLQIIKKGMFQKQLGRSFVTESPASANGLVFPYP